jgi:hypothetical protein
MMNRTLLENVRYIRLNARLPKSLWVEAIIMHAHHQPIYIHNNWFQGSRRSMVRKPVD